MYDKDTLKEYFDKLLETTENDLNLTEKELKEAFSKINKFLKNIDHDIKKAEEDGDELHYNMAINKKNIVLQKLKELENLSIKIKK